MDTSSWSIAFAVSPQHGTSNDRTTFCKRCTSKLLLLLFQTSYDFLRLPWFLYFLSLLPQALAPGCQVTRCRLWQKLDLPTAALAGSGVLGGLQSWWRSLFWSDLPQPLTKEALKPDFATFCQCFMSHSFTIGRNIITIGFTASHVPNVRVDEVRTWAFPDIPQSHLIMLWPCRQESGQARRQSQKRKAGVFLQVWAYYGN